jgi:DHA1 family quinolone resistance protein-like MFS transporter
VIKVLIFSDFLIWSAYNFLAPVFAIYITGNIAGATIETVGIASALYFVCKSVFEVPVGIFIDKTKGEKDDLYTAICGTILFALIYVLYVFIDSVWQLYVLQMFLGISAALAFPGWYSIFTRHIDKEKEGFEWSLYDVFLGLGIAAASALGAFIADFFGFNVLFLVVSSITILGALLLLMIRNKIYTR